MQGRRKGAGKGAMLSKKREQMPSLSLFLFLLVRLRRRFNEKKKKKKEEKSGKRSPVLLQRVYLQRRQRRNVGHADLAVVGWVERGKGSGGEEGDGEGTMQKEKVGEERGDRRARQVERERALVVVFFFLKKRSLLYLSLAATERERHLQAEGRPEVERRPVVGWGCGCV